MQKLLIGQDLDGQLEEKSHTDEARNCHEDSSLQAGCENQRKRHQQPLETERETQILERVQNCGVVKRIAPVNQLRRRRATASGAQIKHLWQRN